MNPSDFYYMIDDDREGYYLVSKEYWKENKCIDDHDLDTGNMIPLWRWSKEARGFRQTGESYFRYYEGREENFETGLQILKSLGIQEILWELEEPLPDADGFIDLSGVMNRPSRYQEYERLLVESEWDYDQDTPEVLLQASLDMLQWVKHPDFGTPSLLIKRITKYLEK